MPPCPPLSLTPNFQLPALKSPAVHWQVESVACMTRVHTCPPLSRCLAVPPSPRSVREKGIGGRDEGRGGLRVDGEKTAGCGRAGKRAGGPGQERRERGNGMRDRRRSRHWQVTAGHSRSRRRDSDRRRYEKWEGLGEGLGRWLSNGLGARPKRAPVSSRGTPPATLSLSPSLSLSRCPPLPGPSSEPLPPGG